MASVLKSAQPLTQLQRDGAEDFTATPVVRSCPFFFDSCYSMVTVFDIQPDGLPIPSVTRLRNLLQEQFVRFCPFLVDACYSMVTGFDIEISLPDYLSPA
jgi:hypothetical protein